MPERFRIPGDALDLALYKLEAAHDRIQELEQIVETIKTDHPWYEPEDLTAAKARIQELEALVDELWIKAMDFEQSRDNWRAKAEAK